MSAADLNSPHQFKLFMTGTEWKDALTHSTDAPIDVKMEESLARSKTPAGSGHGSGVYDSLKTKGYVHDPANPPAIILEESPSGKQMRTVQSEGHHRIAAMADLESQGHSTFYIPTRITDNTRAGRRARNVTRPTV